MALKKCPKCEVNYVREGETYCDVCMRECKREKQRARTEKEAEEPLVCTECGEAAAVPGHELCAECLKEQKRQAELENAVDAGLEDDDFDMEEEAE